jgi:hypothetical protein
LLRLELGACGIARLSIVLDSWIGNYTGTAKRHDRSGYQPAGNYFGNRFCFP